MKVVSIVTFLAGLSGLMAIGAPSARAQSEVDPDHFESPNVESFEGAKINTSRETMAIRYDGKFTLPYAVQCRGKSLPPGRYSVALHSDGKIGQATLKQGGQAIDIPGVVHKLEQKYGSDALVVELNGKTRRLSAIQVAELDLVFELKPPIESSSDGKPRRFQKLLLAKTGRRR
jgi:hypothetical protein